MLQPRLTRFAAIGAGLALLVAACGGSAATSAPTSAPGATVAPDVPGASTVPATPGSNPDVGPLNVAVVTIGSERYEFTDVQCSIFTRQYIQAGNFGGDPEVSIVLPPEGWESQGDTFSPPEVRVTIGDSLTGKQWLAGAKENSGLKPIPAGSSQIDSYTVPDTRPVKATGTATFIDMVALNSGKDAAVETGTFEVSCP